MTYSQVLNKLYEELSVDPRGVELKVVMRYPMAGAYVAIPLNDDNAVRAMWIAVTQSSSVAMQLFIEQVPKEPVVQTNTGSFPGMDFFGSVDQPFSTGVQTRDKAIKGSAPTSDFNEVAQVDPRLNNSWMSWLGNETYNNGGEFEVGQQFDSLQQLKDAVKSYSVARNQTIRVVEAEPEKYVVECKRKEQCSCSWRLRGVKDPTLSTFKIVRYNGPHASNCVGDIDSGDHKLLTSEFVCNALLDVIRVDPSLKIKTMITLTGFMFLMTSALLGYLYSPRLDSPPPRWVHFMHGLLLFLYQTFDAVDGKQARRTNSSSSLGELFDHGCDALACAFEALAFGSTAMCGRATFWFWVIAAIPFYGATWEHYFTNTLILPVINGPTEGLMLIYLCHFFTTFVGAEWWAQQFGASIPFLSWVPFFSGIPTYQVALYLMIASGVIPTVAFNIQNVYNVVKLRKGSMLLALAMLYPFVVLLVGVLVWYSSLTFTCFWDYLSPSDLIGTYPHLVVVGTGLAFGFLVSLLYLPLAIANALTARLNDGVPLVDESLVLLGYCAFTGLLGKKHEEGSWLLVLGNCGNLFIQNVLINFVLVDV
uniref:Transposase MuDR plant domain-containing protein n=1 Tax=Chenopodium quinoa TaxID=63459 RepID=A0A803LK66_CHEQI